MPYRLSDDGLCVQKKENGKWGNLKCYGDHQKALDYLGALEANVKKAQTFQEAYATQDRDKIWSEIWRLTDGINTALTSAVFDRERDDPTTEQLIGESLDAFVKAVKEQAASWAKGEAFSKDAPASLHEIKHIAKVDEAEQLVFGWFNVAVRADGEILKDLQNDMIEPAELEKAAYDFVLQSREGGMMHKGDANAVLVESMVFTPEKLAAMETQSGGVVKMHVPPGWWWGGFKVNTPEDFAKVVSGEYNMFSIEGTAVRMEEATDA